MTYKTRAEAFTIENVTQFQGWSVDGGELTLSDDEYVEILNELFGEVSVCGFMYGSGNILLDQSPTTFNCMKSDHEDHIQTELEEQLEREDDSDIQFEVDPDDIDEEEDEE